MGRQRSQNGENPLQVKYKMADVVTTPKLKVGYFGIFSGHLVARFQDNNYVRVTVS